MLEFRLSLFQRIEVGLVEVGLSKVRNPCCISLPGVVFLHFPFATSARGSRSVAFKIYESHLTQHHSVVLIFRNERAPSA